MGVDMIDEAATYKPDGTFDRDLDFEGDRTKEELDEEE